MGMSCLSWRAICQDKTDTRTLVTLTGADWHVVPVGPAVSVTVGVSHAKPKTIIIIIIIIIIVLTLTSWILCCTWSGMPILCCSVPGCSDRCEAGPVQGRSPGLKIKVRWIINWPVWGYEIARLDRFFCPSRDDLSSLCKDQSWHLEKSHGTGTAEKTVVKQISS